MDEKTDDPLKWPEFELKFKEFYHKRSLEAQKLATEFTKIIVTNLIWINAAGIGALPVTTSFVGISSLRWEEKYALIYKPMWLFAGGLVAAIVCAFMIYINFAIISRVMNNYIDMDIYINRFSSAENCNDSNNTREILYMNYMKAKQMAAYLENWINIAFILSIGLGCISIVLFICACQAILHMRSL